MPYLPNSDDCFACGRENPIGLKVRFRVESDQVVTTFTADEYRCSYHNVVHGGVLSALLDETMGWAPCYQKRLFCYAAELRVRFLSPTPCGIPLTVRGWITADRGKLWETEGSVSGPDGTVYARAWGKYMPMTADQTRSVMDYLHFDEETIPREQIEG